MACASSGLTYAQDARPFPQPLPIDKILGPAPQSRILVGLLGGVTYNMHTGKFSVREDGLLCCSFDGGSGVGPNVAAKIFYRLSEDGLFFVGVRAGFEEHDGSFEGDLEELPILGRDNQVETAFFSNDLDAALPALSFQPFVSYRVLPLDLYVTTGPSVQYYPATELTKTHAIDDPSGVVFLDGTTSFELASVNVESLSTTTFGWDLGLDCIIPLSAQLSLGVEGLYRLPLTKLTADEEWSVSNLIGSIGAYYRL
jgi:hypothetical protein